MSKVPAYLRPLDPSLIDSEPIIKLKPSTDIRVGSDEEKNLILNSTIEDQVTCVFKMYYTASEGLKLIVTYTGNGKLIVNKLKFTRCGNSLIVQPGSIIQINHFRYLYFIGNPGDLKKEQEICISDKYNISITNVILGKGSSSMVSYAYVKKHPELRLACKEVYPTDKRYGGYSSQDLVRREIKILKDLSHANVVMLIHSYETPITGNSEPISRIFTPFCTYGTLQTYTEADRVRKDNSARFIFYQLMLGLRYIHEKGYIHKDIKPENILIDYNMRLPRVIIADFGIALLKSEARSTTARLGTALIKPPETLGRNQDYDEKVDCWAAGIVLFYILTGGEFPFFATNPYEVEELILTREPDMDYPFIQNEDNYGTELILRLLEKQSEKRASCSDCIKSKWISGDPNIHNILANYLKITQAFNQEKKHWFNNIKGQPLSIEQNEAKVNEQHEIPRWWKKLKQSDYIVNGTRRHFLRKGTYAFAYKITKWSTAKKGYIHGNLRQYLGNYVKAA